MQVTLNFSAPLHFCSVDLVEALSSRFIASVVRLRCRALYPDRREWIAFVESALPFGGVCDAAHQLAVALGQDYVDMMVQGGGLVMGPRAEQHLPFDREAFAQY